MKTVSPSKPSSSKITSNPNFEQLKPKSSKQLEDIFSDAKGDDSDDLSVLSDGMTRGSIPELKNSINFASKNKISVIGVGIGNRGSWKEYENNVQVQHPEQLIYSIVNITKDILIKNIKTTTGAA